jgi:hypothetical protein
MGGAILLLPLYAFIAWTGSTSALLYLSYKRKTEQLVIFFSEMDVICLLAFL